MRSDTKCCHLTLILTNRATHSLPTFETNALPISLHTVQTFAMFTVTFCRTKKFALQGFVQTECQNRKIKKLLIDVTWLAVFSVSPRFTHLTGRSMEALFTETLPAAEQPVQALTVVGAPVIHSPRTFGAIMPKVSWTAGVVLEGKLLWGLNLNLKV